MFPLEKQERPSGKVDVEFTYYLLSLLDCFLIDSTTLPPCLYPKLGWAYCYVLIIHNGCEMSLELKIFNPSSLFGIHGLLMKDSKLQSAMPPLSHKLPFSPQLIERTKKRGEKGLNVVIKRGETMTKGALRGQVGQKMGRKGEKMMTKGSECGTCLDSFKTPQLLSPVSLLNCWLLKQCVPKGALMLLILILVAAVLVGGHLKSRSCQTD